MFQQEKPGITFVRPIDEQEMNNHFAKPSRFDEVSKDLTASFDDLNGDCLVNILSCLSSEDMNSVAICSERCREARVSDSLDQTRTGTTMCTENTTLEGVRNTFVRQEWNEVFSGNRTRMKIVGLERMPLIREDDFEASVSESRSSKCVMF